MTDGPKVERLPGLVTRDATALAAVSGRFKPQSIDIPGLWTHFFSVLSPSQIDGDTYGVSQDMADGEFTYAVAARLAPGVTLPEGFETLNLPGGGYLVSRITTTGGNLSAQFMSAMGQIWGQVVPASGFAPSGGPMFELYRPGFAADQPGHIIDFYIPVEA